MDLLEITNNQKRHPWELAKKDIAVSLIASTKKNNIRFLDIGSGDAYLANSFTNEFEDSQAYCVDTGYTTSIKDKIDSKFNNSRLNLFSSLDQLQVDSIDVVTLLDVIEHVPDDVEFLREIMSRPYINNDTVFIISVPAYQFLFSQHDELLKHYRRYNLRKLKTVMDSCNMAYSENGYYFSILLLPRLIQILRQKIKPKKSELANLGTWKGGPKITALVKSILLLDYRISKIFKFFGINLPGLSCFIICKSRNNKHSSTG